MKTFHIDEPREIGKKRLNEFNEKTIIGFMSFAVMTLYSLTDLITGYMGMELPINDFVYNSFLYITLGCFGIAGVEKVMGGKKDA